MTTGYVPWSLFNAHDWSKFNAPRHSGTMGCGEGGEYHNGAYHFLTVDGQVMSTGNGSYAQTGDDDHDHRFAPSPILF